MKLIVVKKKQRKRGPVVVHTVTLKMDSSGPVSRGSITIHTDLPLGTEFKLVEEKS